MMRFRSRRSRGFQIHSSLAAELQQLEPRTLPTGTVTATLSSGNLTIAGDNLDNSILIVVRAEGVFLTGIQDANSDPATFTKIKFGSTTYSDGEEVSLTNTVSLKSLTISMRAGNDNVRMEVGEALPDPLPDPVPAPLAVMITGRVRINLGKGNDHGVILVNNATLNVTGNLEGDLENGDDCLIVGPANDFSDSPMEPPETAPIQVGGSVIILGRLGNDVIALAGTEVQKSVNLLGGDHFDSIAVLDDLIHGNLSINGNAGSDDIGILSVGVQGTTTVRGEGGFDRVAIGGLAAGKNVTVYLGAGNDQLAVGALDVADDKVRFNFDGGTGTDAFLSESEVTDPPIKLHSMEDSAVAFDPLDIVNALEAIVNECIVATTPPTFG